MLRLVFLSDTHGRHASIAVPPGDVLLHCGDWIRHRGSIPEIVAFNAWLRELPHRHKVIIAGNHGLLLEDQPHLSQLITHATYLQDSMVEIEGMRVYGTPWTPYFYGWAFNVWSDKELRRIYERIPSDLDVLLTHGPPAGTLDRTVRGDYAGCHQLKKAVKRADPAIHAFGHIHDSAGVVVRGRFYVNAAYHPKRDITVIDYDPATRQAQLVVDADTSTRSRWSTGE